MTDRSKRDERLERLFTRGGVIKICGLREPSHAATAAAAGANLVGFIFAPARRQVSPSVAGACIRAAREAAAGREVLAVGVFVNADPHEVTAIADEAGLDVLQLHGQEPPLMIASFDRPVIKVVRPRPEEQLEDVVAELARYQAATKPPRAFLLDGYSPETHGGSGHRANWELVRSVCDLDPVMLGGGLDPGNAADAIQTVRPLGVDVSSGVETDGIKDAVKIEAFIVAARLAFRS